MNKTGSATPRETCALYSSCRVIPPLRNVRISRTGLRVEFEWWSDPGFTADDTTLEIEVVVAPKCYAQPLGGKDDDDVFA